jgi:light-regulated signal transduction histidine kinase (bacteriophytochrome)
VGEALRKAHDELEQRVEERTAKLAKANEQLNLEIENRKRVEEALRLAHRELEIEAGELQAANEELSQYAYVVSHDLKAPLRAIHNYADFLREDLEETLVGDQKQYLGGLNRAVRQGEQLVDDLLELSRVGARSGPRETIDIGVFLRELIASLDLSSDVEVVMGNDWPTIDTEPTLFRQIFQNLIRNAIKFNDSPRKRVEIGWNLVGDDRYEVFVRDNGIGIEPRNHEKIFGVFQRLHTREEYGGTGLGLAIVKKATSKLHGSVRVESKPGEGSIFFVAFSNTHKEL